MKDQVRIRILFVAICLYAIAMSGCGSGIRRTVVDLTKTVSTPTDGSAALAYMTEPVIEAGAPATTVTIHGAGFQQTSQLIFDGVKHASTYESATEMQFSLSVSELASPKRHSVQVQNSGANVPASNTLTLLVTSGYTAFGDSITYGGGVTTRLTDAYPFLLGNMLSLSVQDAGISGDQACDIFPHQIYGNAIGYATTSVPLYSFMAGTNDADHYGIGSYEAVYNNCHRAVIAWLGTSRADKLLPGDTALTVTGSCSQAANAQYQGGLYCASGSSGTIEASAFQTTGHPIYIWYTLSDAATSNATFDVKIDGALQTSVSSKPGVPVSTYNGTSQSVGMVRLSVSAGNHDVVITTAGGIAIQGIGTNRGGADRPQVVVGDIPWQLEGDPIAPDDVQVEYSADIQANIASALTDGIDVRFAQDRYTMLGLPPEMFDRVHPNTLGHQHLTKAFLAALE